MPDSDRLTIAGICKLKAVERAVRKPSRRRKGLAWAFLVGGSIAAVWFGVQWLRKQGVLL